MMNRYFWVNMQQNFALLGPAYHRVAQTYFRFAEYEDCVLYNKRVSKVKDCTVTKEEYYTEFALAIYYMDDFG